MTHDEKMVEAVARAIVKSTGKDPDEQTSWDNGWLTSGPRWQSRMNDAREHIAAFEAIRAHLAMTGKQF